MYFKKNIELIMESKGGFLEAKEKLAKKLHIENVNELRVGTLCPDQEELCVVYEQQWNDWMLVGSKAIDGKYYYDIMTPMEYDMYEKRTHDFFKDCQLSCNLEKASELVLDVMQALSC